MISCRVREFRQFSEKSDAYSFGVFLLELLSGKEATESPHPNTNQNLVESVYDHFFNFVIRITIPTISLSSVNHH